jgi:uncharacterized membrane protein
MDPNQDADHIRLLSIFHYVEAAFTGLFACFPVIHLTLGLAMLLGVFEDSGHGNAPPRALGLLFIIPALMFIVFGILMAVCIGISGYKLGQFKSYTYCLVIAALECVLMPFGTILGVFTILVLLRPSVKLLFESQRTGDNPSTESQSL